jgi:hypothetical protein
MKIKNKIQLKIKPGKMAWITKLNALASIF